jgi:hypothetical protein
MQTADTYRHDNWTTEKEAHAHNKGNRCTTPFLNFKHYSGQKAAALGAF